MEGRVRLLCLSDVHGNLEAAQSFVSTVRESEELREVDAVVVAGDIGDPRSSGSFERVVSELSKLEKPILYVRGNWDVEAPKGVVRDDPLVADLESLGPLDLKGVLLVGHASTFEARGGKSRKPLVLVTHYPPFSVLDKGRKADALQYGPHAGLPEINYLVAHYKPLVHIFGHCHALGGLEVRRGGTLFVNVARLDRVSADGRVMGNYAYVDIDVENRTVSVKWRFIGGTWKRCTKCKRTVHLPPEWSLCRGCSNPHELRFERLDRRLERVTVRVTEAARGTEVMRESVYIPLYTLKDGEAYEDFVSYILTQKLKKALAGEGVKVLPLSKGEVIEYYSKDSSNAHAFSEFLFSCKEEKVGKRVCALMRVFYLDKRARVLWRIRVADRAVVEREVLLAHASVLKHRDLVEELERAGFQLLVYEVRGEG